LRVLWQRVLSTYRLWLKDDEKFHGLKRLNYKKVEVSLGDVLMKGIHPEGGELSANPDDSLFELVVRLLDDSKPKELEYVNTPYDIKVQVMAVCRPRNYGYKAPALKDLFNWIRKDCYFAESFSYPGLFDLAKEKLHEIWSDKVARNLLGRVYHTFEERRNFIKSKNPQLKIRSYADIRNCNLSTLFRPEDFYQADTKIVKAVFPCKYFFLADCIKRLTDEDGRLRPRKSINYFTLKNDGVHYNCEVKGKCVVFRPDLGEGVERRRIAERFAARWRMGGGKYCFTTNIENVELMLRGDLNSRERCEISFHDLKYSIDDPSKPERPTKSGAFPKLEKILVYGVGSYPTTKITTHRAINILRAYGVSGTGKKAVLEEKLAHLADKLYRERKEELDRYFGENKFIRVGFRSTAALVFPVMEDDENMRSLVLAIYVLKHLRGNVILDSAYENNDVDVYSLAISLIREKIKMRSAFLKVE